MIPGDQIAEALGEFVRTSAHGEHEDTATSLALLDAGLDPDGATRAAMEYARLAFPSDAELQVVTAAGVLTGMAAGALAVKRGAE